MVSRIDEIMQFVAAKGLAGVHPFNAFPYTFYEGGVLGRDKTIEACLRLIDICGEFWIFGISEGTLRELAYVLEENKKGIIKPIRNYVKQFDPEWDIYSDKYKSSYKDVLDQLETINDIDE